VTQVVLHFIAKDNECAAYKSSNAIWVTTCASPIDEIAQFENGRNVTAKTRVEGETFEVGREVSETMDARPALTGSLLLHVADHPSRFSQWAMPAREEDHDSGAQRRVQLPGRFFAEATVEEVGDGDPTSPITPQKCSPVPVAILCGERQEVSEGDAKRRFDNQRLRPPPGDSEQHGAGRIMCPEGPKPLASIPADHGYVGERLHVLYQRGSTAYAMFANRL